MSTTAIPEQREAASLRDFSSDEERRAAIERRDAAADGRFYYSVRTTGVYCRPSCASRPARPENVRFHATREDAEHAGFRPCKRCRPDLPSLAAHHATMVAEACRTIEAADSVPSLDALAQASGLSRFHFHRVFKAVTGVTPRAYAAAHRAKRVRQGLQTAPTVTQAIYESGYASSGRFYAASNGLLGMTPTAFRSGGADATIQFAIGQASLGSVLVAATDRGVCVILLGDEPDLLVRDLQDRFPNAAMVGDDPEFARLVATVIGFIEAPQTGLHLPLDIRGTAFQRRVWEALREIPAGSTASYADVAKRIGSPNATRAVAQACAANMLAIAVPCHRVVRSDHSLSGYRWGVERKRALLDSEAAATAADARPPRP